MRCICGFAGFCGLDCYGFTLFAMGWFGRLLLLVQIGSVVLVLIWCLCCLCGLAWAFVIAVVLWVS